MKKNQNANETPEQAMKRAQWKFEDEWHRDHVKNAADLQAKLRERRERRELLDYVFRRRTGK